MEKIVLLVTFFVSCLTIMSLAAPQNYFPFQEAKAAPKAKEAAKDPIPIVAFEQSQSPTKSEFYYEGGDGSSRRETLILESVKDGSKELLVPFAVGDFNYTTSDGTQISQSYSSGIKGNLFSIIRKKKAEA